MSAKGFKINGEVHRYDYSSLDNIDVQTSHIHSGAITVDKLDSDVKNSLERVNDVYEQMTVSGIENGTPYTSRPVGGSSEINSQENLNKVIGGTICIEQLVDGSFGSSTGWSRISSNCTLTFESGGVLSVQTNTTSNANGAKYAATIIPSHKYICRVQVKPTAQTKVRFMYTSATGGSASGTRKQTISNTSAWTWYESIVNIGSDSTATAFSFYTDADGQLSANAKVRLQNMTVFDLTGMLGPTIADYVYNLEVSTTGAGITWLKNHFSFFGKDYIDHAAAQLLSVKTSAHKTIGFNAYNNITGKAKIFGGNVYQITGSYGTISLNGTSISPDANGYFTPSENGELVVIGGNSTDTCVHLKWDGSRDGEWEAYNEHTYNLDSDLELRGIPKLDASNNLYYDGDEYVPSGAVTRHWGIRAYQSGDVTNGSTMITDGTNTVYQLSAATVTSAAAYTASQTCDRFGTEEFVDSRAVPMPVGHDTVYVAGVTFPIGLPDPPTSNGTYKLLCTVSNGAVVYSWVSNS